MTGKQELALTVAKMAVNDWRKAHGRVLTERVNAQAAIRAAVKAGVSQAAIAEAVGWPRQRVHTMLG